MTECYGCGEEITRNHVCPPTPGDWIMPVLGFGPLLLFMVALVVNAIGRIAGAW